MDQGICVQADFPCRKKRLPDKKRFSIIAIIAKDTISMAYVIRATHGVDKRAIYLPHNFHNNMKLFPSMKCQPLLSLTQELPPKIDKNF